MAKRDPSAGPHGILVVDKPKGPTSHDIVSGARRHFSTRRVGHAGTLDPMATGVLILLLGEATKLSNYLTGASKRYAATVQFGVSTDSQDAEGVVEERRELPDDWLTEAQLAAALQAERERTEQIPPTVSAIKVDGQRSYKLHRIGQAPDLPARTVSVQSLTVQSWSSQRAELILQVSKGYYVRALARDIGVALGVPAHLSALRRLASGTFEESEACSWPPSTDTRPVPLEVALPRLLPICALSEEGVLHARQGKLLEKQHFASDTQFPDAEALMAWTDSQGKAVALGRQTQEGFRVTRGFIPLPGD